MICPRPCPDCHGTLLNTETVEDPGSVLGVECAQITTANCPQCFTSYIFVIPKVVVDKIETTFKLSVDSGNGWEGVDV